MGKDEAKVQEFAWSFARFDKIDANEVAAELRTIQADGALTAAAVVEFAAAHPRSALHGCFEWDDSIAARRQREATARQVIRSLRVVVTKGKVAEPRRVYVVVREIQKGYVPIVSIKSESAHAALMREAAKQLAAWTRRYEELQKIRPESFRAIQSAVADLQEHLDDELLPIAAE